MYVGSLDPQSNQATFKRQFELWDSDSDEFIDLTLATIELVIRDNASKTSMLSASIDDGIELLDDGVFEVTFTAAQMGGLCAGEYDVGLIITDEITVQLIIGTIIVMDGIVT